MQRPIHEHRNIKAAKVKIFKFCQPSSQKCEDQCHQWWNEECKKEISAASKSKNAATLLLRSEWSWPRKKKVILTVHWNVFSLAFISN
jgi:hypothetical protein